MQISNLKILEKSLNSIGATAIYMAKDGDKTVLILAGQDKCGFKAEDTGDGKFRAELTHENAVVLRKHFPWTAPVKGLTSFISFGLGDRLGIASPGHIDLIKNKDIFPFLAQQSIRELNLTKRTYDDVLDAATFAVFREGYKKGYGADGNNLKTAEDVKKAISLGFTMITLDCAGLIKNGAVLKTDIPQKYIDKYLNVEFDIEGIPFIFTKEELGACIAVYGGAISFAAQIYRDFFASGKCNADLEISINEAETSTPPLHHYFIARELLDSGVVFTTIAPRFCGDFQKGIDFIGDIEQFEKEINVHAAITRSLGYKLSIHSGSDKFKIFPIIKKACRGNLHLKTSGTNWLEAIRVVAVKDPAFFSEIYKYALTVFDEANKNYHVTADVSKIPDMQKVKDEELSGLFDSNNDLRQLMHITYGFIINTFKDRLYALLQKYEDDYRSAVIKHIGKHIELLT